MSDLAGIIKKIEENKILLPDFQRDFVWTEPERQRQIVASVLARMPIGSILLLKSTDPTEFSSKSLGQKTKINTESINGTVEFLLDGQQRMTVLTNVFSSVLFKGIGSVTELVSTSLKRRFFLCLPKWRCNDDTDKFGISNLTFPEKNLGDEPTFLTNDLLEYIIYQDFKAGGGEPYNPFNKQADGLSDYCAGYKDGYLIPLYLVASVDRKDNRTLNFIKEKIKGSYCETVVTYYAALESDNDREMLCQKYDMELMSVDDFEFEIKALFETWWSQLNHYLNKCVNEVNLNLISIDESQRGRAIDIYENLNRGGVCLNTFDLLMARVAKVSKENYLERIYSFINADKTYPIEVVPEEIEGYAGAFSEKHYNASMEMGVFNKNGQLSSRYIDIFLDVLGICSRVPDLLPDKMKLDYIKKNYILDLMPEQIDKNTESVITAIDRAMFFLQTRCGVRKIQEVNYSLMVVLIAVVFTVDDYFKTKKIHKLLEGWYWASIFSGEYDKDQNSNFINNLKSILMTIKKEKKCSWVIDMKEMAFDSKNFSDKELLLMTKAEDRVPKKVLQNYICQFMLSRPYSDMFNPNEKISVFSDNADDFEAHHIIPLGSAKKVGEVTATLRKDSKHICNSPMNFVFITKSSNKKILDKPLNEYANDINDQAKEALHIGKYKRAIDDAEKIREILEERFDALKGDVKNRIDNCLSGWK
ncbi:DUF262 domain-containing protein [Anaerovibrio sp.]|uniref:DUF262 domain-containing protein n=1 Tax=Anaerovibrio sp. TaxID=1872532 RepID=UPI0025BB7DFD|nr:DUF262 domain-containing protein [Anaerovibrio sp.]MBR2142530.1 DUF262 domain-containing protein [Anaerovibrio sp.]